MKIIKVSFDIPQAETGNSANEVISNANKGIRATRSSADSKLLNGKLILDLYASDEMFTFVLEDNIRLRMFLSNRETVGWAIEKVPRDLKFNQKKYPDDVRLEYENGTNVVWQRGELMRKRLNKKFLRFFAAPCFSYVYVEDCLILMFKAAMDKTTGAAILSWHDTD